MQRLETAKAALDVHGLALSKAALPSRSITSLQRVGVAWPTGARLSGGGCFGQYVV